MAFIAAAHADGNPVASVAPTVPTGTADGDILFGWLKSGLSVEADPTTVPTGWTLVAKAAPALVSTYWLYYKIASSESGSYTWTWATSTRRGATVYTYRSGFSVASLSDITVSNTAYTTSDTTLRAASFSVPTANSVLIWFGGSHYSASTTITDPTVPGSGFTSPGDVNDQYSGASRALRELTSQVWSGSGASGDMDGTLGVSNGDKHAFAVALNPSSGGGSVVPVLMRQYRMRRQ